MNGYLNNLVNTDSVVSTKGILKIKKSTDLPIYDKKYSQQLAKIYFQSTINTSD